jgi:mono/diheme cytochrome c family protein
MRLDFPRRLGWLLACLLLGALAAPTPSAEVKKIDFAHDVLPILKARCSECHTNGKYKGSVSFDTRADLLKSKAAVPGKSAVSEMIRRVTSKDPDERMPPKGPALTAAEVQRLRAWIDQGLPWESGFSFKVAAYVPPLKPRRPKLPPARPGLEHPIDRIIAAYHKRHKVKPPLPLDDAGFARRASLDLIGLLPAPAELDAFLKDAVPDRRAKLVRRLLDDNRAYADHWLSFWNDLLRNDYTGTGYIDGGRKPITAWLYRGVADNKPYDRFVRELIQPSGESEGFIRGIKWRGNVNASQVVELQFAQNVGQVFFGVNIKCASCHDSFIDRWKLDDAYRLAAIVADRPLEIHRCDKPTGRKATPGFLFPDLGTIDAKLPKAKRLEQLAALITHADNGRFSRTIANRIWQRLMGRGIVHPVDVMANRPWSEDLLDYLAVYLTDQRYDLKKLMEHIATSRAYGARAVVVKEEPSGEEYIFRGPEVKRLSAEQFMDAVWQITRAGPGQANASVPATEFAKDTPGERRFVRAALVPSNALLRSLGRPNREQVVTTRPDLLTTLQALDLSNGQLLADTLAGGAARMLRDDPKATPEQRVRALYRQALGRPPTEGELGVARELLGTPVKADGLADLLWAVFMLPEFQLIR